MNDEYRNRLNGLDRESLIEEAMKLSHELLERRAEGEDREEEFIGLEAAEKISDAEADKYARLLKVSDLMVIHLATAIETMQVDPTNGMTPEVIEAYNALRVRVDGYIAYEDRKKSH